MTGDLLKQVKKELCARDLRRARLWNITWKEGVLFPIHWRMKNPTKNIRRNCRSIGRKLKEKKLLAPVGDVGSGPYRNGNIIYAFILHIYITHMLCARQWGTNNKLDKFLFSDSSLFTEELSKEQPGTITVTPCFLSGSVIGNNSTAKW